jgi:hypothetical protein
MDVPVLGFDGYATVTPPAGGFWRVSAWPRPFDPPPPAAPLDADPREDDGNRYDDPDGRFKTLYCATDPEGAIGECLGDFGYSASAARRIEEFLVGEPDEGHDEEYQHPLTAEDIKGFQWKLAHAPADSGARVMDIEHPRSHIAVAPKAVPAVLRYGVKRFDRSTLLDERRYVTRTLAGIYRADATNPATGELLAAGLRFTSRLAPAWECWALWEPLPLHAEAATTEDVTIDTPALRRAAGLLGVALAAP